MQACETKCDPNAVCMDAQNVIALIWGALEIKATPQNGHLPVVALLVPSGPSWSTTNEYTCTFTASHMREKGIYLNP